MGFNERLIPGFFLEGPGVQCAVRSLEILDADSGNLPVVEARLEIDRLPCDDLRNFADAHQSTKHLFGLQHYADVMSAFAAGERYINRTWSASTDGYVDEARSYLERATHQCREAGSLFAEFRQQYQSTLSPD